MKAFTISLLLLTAPVFLVSDRIFATALSDSVLTVKRLVEEEKYARAIENLKLLLTQVEQKMTQRVVELYPAPLTGWRRMQVKPQQPGLGVYGGGTNLKCVYNKDNSRERVEISFLIHSPVIEELQQLSEQIDNAAGVTGVMLVGDNRGVVEIDSDRQRGVLKVIISAESLLTISGFNFSDESDLRNVLLSYAEALDSQELSKIVSK
jgi:hypothetical protein